MVAGRQRYGEVDIPERFDIITDVIGDCGRESQVSQCCNQERQQLYNIQTISSRIAARRDL